jgi:hypothetical protein
MSTRKMVSKLIYWLAITLSLNEPFIDTFDSFKLFHISLWIMSLKLLKGINLDCVHTKKILTEKQKKKNKESMHANTK